MTSPFDSSGTLSASNRSMAHTEIVIASLFLALTWTVVALRFWVRHHMLHSTGADDWFILLSQIFFTTYCASHLIILHLVPGDAPRTYAIAQTASAEFIANTAEFAWSMIFLKLSLGAFFLRIITSPWQRGVVYFVMVISTFANLVECFFLIFMCGDPHEFLIKITLQQCAPWISQAFVAYGQAATNTLTDLTLALLPIPLLWNSNMKRAQKISVGMILMLATAGIICSALRFIWIPDILQSDRSKFFKTIKPLAIICIAELGSGILVSSLSTLRPLFTTFFDMATIKYNVSRSVSRFTDRSPNNNSESSGANDKQKLEGSNNISSQDSELYEIQGARMASMKESFFTDADSRTGVFPDRRDKEVRVQVRRPDEMEREREREFRQRREMMAESKREWSGSEEDLVYEGV